MLAEIVFDAINEVLSPIDQMVPLHEPTFTSSELDIVSNCIKSTFVSSVGPLIQKFEGLLSDYTEIKYVVCVANGTVALEMALRVSGVKPGDEVLIPSLSFVATANAVLHLGALPVFIDADENTLGMSSESLDKFLRSGAKSKDGVLINSATGNRIAAIVPMHTLGHPVNIKDIAAISKEFDVPIVEDMAESLGSFYGQKHTGNFGLTAALSFNGNKIITTGGGGAVLTNNEDIATKLRHITTTAKAPHPWEFHHTELGWNYRMPNLNAALGVAQIKKLPYLLSDKRKLASKYESVFNRLDGVKFIVEPENSSSNYWLNAIQFTGHGVTARNEVLEFLAERNIQARPLWNLLPSLPHLSKFQVESSSVSQKLIDSIVCIPSSAHLVNRGEVS